MFMKKTILSLLLGAAGLSLAFSADAKKPGWMLSEDPAQIITNPTGTLAQGRAYQGTPNIVVSQSGKRGFAICYGGGTEESTHNYVMVSYLNEYLTGKPGVDLVIRSPHTGKVRCFDPAGWRDPQGRVWIAWCQSTGEYSFTGKRKKPGEPESQWSRHGSTWAIYTDNPDDAQPTWSAPRRLFDGNMINKPLFLKNGDGLYPVCFFTMPYVNDLLRMKEGAGVWLSQDKGETFKQIGNVIVPDSKYAEHMLVEMNDGRIWMIARREPNSNVRMRHSRQAGGLIHTSTYTDGISEAFSKDGGRTFSEAKYSKIHGNGSRTYLARLKSGNLLLLKNYANDDLWLAGKPKQTDGEPVPRKIIVGYISKDDGKTWEGGLIFDDVRAITDGFDRKYVAYPDASEADNGFIYVVWDYFRYNEPEIRVAKVTEADILAGKIISKGSVPLFIANKGGKMQEDAVLGTEAQGGHAD